MRKTAIISLILVIFLSACQTDKDLKGTWIGDYSSSFNSDNPSMIFAIQNLMTFENNKVYAQGSDRDFGTDQIRESKRMFLSDNIVFNDEYSEENPLEYYEIVKVNADSLVVKIPNNEFLHIYRKLSEKLKNNQKVELTRKTFYWKNEIFQDTIYFVTDSTFKRKTNKDTRFKTSRWERINHKGFDILFLDGDVPYLIENKKEKTIELRTFHKTELKHTMTELE
ncbi:hypothetical protein ACJOV8_016105 [Formosa sp. 3Alg 14/1]|uniref:hypothetical protein n=1 Tax=Formosa sp. 3Alg 14/1 TaxID=3382190 RepID=UPI0039BE92CE